MKDYRLRKMSTKSYNKYLYEGLFDDDIFDIENSITDTFEEQMDKLNIQELLDILSENFKKAYDNYKSSDKRIYMHKDQDCAYFYYLASDRYMNDENTNNERIYEDIMLYDPQQAQKVINCLIELNISYVFATIRIYGKHNENIDFKDVQFISYILENLNVNNLLVDFSDRQDHQYIEIYKKARYFYNSNLANRVDFLNCQLNDNILINQVSHICIKHCSNINDFSFIKNISNEFKICYLGGKTLPKCNSLQGIPKNNYKLNIIYEQGYGTSDDNYNNIPIQSLKGINNNLSEIYVTIQESPTNFLQYFSFEGLTEEILPKLTFSSRFPGKFRELHVQLGPYDLQVKARHWHPTKPQYLTIIKTQDWFLDCYEATPHKTYNKLDYDIDDKDISKEVRKVEKYKQQKQDAIEDLNKMVDNLKKILKPKQTYYQGKTWQLYILECTDTHIKVRFIRRWSMVTHIFTYIDFIKKQLLRDSENWRTGLEQTDKLLKDLVCKPVQNQRQKILAQRKEQEKQEKLQKKEKLKNITSKEDNTQVVNTPAVQKTSDVEIVDYSARAIAVIGNTYDIKDQLKEIGAFFNRNLVINGKKTAGWILSKKKRAEVEKII